MPKLKPKKIAIIFVIIGGLVFGLWQLDLISKTAKREIGKQTISTPSPLVYHIEDAPFYSEENWCWGSSALMLLMDRGFTEDEVQEARNIIKTRGRGGPPDMFIALQEYDLIDDVRIVYSKDYVKEYADFYNRQLLVNPKEQVILLDGQDKALNKLKELISTDNLVMIVGHHGNHYMIATGYDENYIYLNDPGADDVFFQKVDYQDEYQEKTKMLIANFFEQWTVSGFEGGGIGFPGDYGMIWLVK